MIKEVIIDIHVHRQKKNYSGFIINISKSNTQLMLHTKTKKKKKGTFFFYLSYCSYQMTKKQNIYIIIYKYQ